MENMSKQQQQLLHKNETRKNVLKIDKKKYELIDEDGNDGLNDVILLVYIDIYIITDEWCTQEMDAEQST